MTSTLVALGRRSRAGLLAALVAAALAGDPAPSATIEVAARGADSPTCGSKGSPCRSIGHAVARAHRGDTISVGPGEYTEDASIPCGNEVSDAMICIDKRLTLVSTHGAAATVIHGSSDLVAIVADGTVFGTPKRGFTVRGELDGSTGISVEADSVRIGGNLIARNTFGLELRGRNAIVSANLVLDSEYVGLLIAGGGHLVKGNTVSGSLEVGFDLYGDPSDPLRIEGNVAVANGDCGFCIEVEPGDTVQLLRNAAFGNDVGFEAYGLGVGGTLRLSSSNTYGNARCGLLVRAGAHVEAVETFWGAATGPGSDPADEVCADTESVASVILPAARPVRVRGVGAIP